MALGIDPKVSSFQVMSLVLAATLVTLFSGMAQARDEEGLAGEWEAKTTNPMTREESVVILTLVEANGRWSGTLGNPAGESQDLRSVRVDGHRLQFKFPANEMNIDVGYSGALDPETGMLIGNVESPMGEQELKFHRRVTSVVGDDGHKQYAIGSGPAGVWFGKIKMADADDRLVTLTLDSDDQNGEAFSILDDSSGEVIRGEDVNISDTMVSFTYRPKGQRYPSHFTGSYVAADDRLSGSFSQRGTSRFVKFKRDPETTVLGFTDDGKVIEPARTRHQHNFGLTGRLTYWQAMHLVKDLTYNINNVTASRFGFDGSVRWFAVDDFSLFFRAYRGGMGMTDDEEKLAPHADIGLNSESSLNIDGWEFGATGYFGNLFSENSPFNPYLTASFGKAAWEVNAEGRGSDILSIERDPLEGSDWAFGIGLGTEYELTSTINLEFEWMWRNFRTQDDTIWRDTENQWANTHAWTISAGVTYMFF